MSNRLPDTKLARRLQKRGKWDSYSACLRAVQQWMAAHDSSMREIKDAIDRGGLDPQPSKGSL